MNAFEAVKQAVTTRQAVAIYTKFLGLHEEVLS
jgi:hypothetical protein